MEDTQHRVWQRVLSQPDQEQEDLRGLLNGARELAAVYQRLLLRQTGQRRELLQQLYETARRNVFCLRGMCRLSGQNWGKQKPLPLGQEQEKRLLQICYHRSRRAMTEYTARSAQTEYGPVYQKMARREEDQCDRLSQLLGQWE